MVQKNAIHVVLVGDSGSNFQGTFDILVPTIMAKCDFVPEFLQCLMCSSMPRQCKIGMQFLRIYGIISPWMSFINTQMYFLLDSP